MLQTLTSRDNPIKYGQQEVYDCKSQYSSQYISTLFWCHQVSKRLVKMEPPLNSQRVMRRVVFNRAFALLYTIAIFALLYHHALNLVHTTSLFIFFINIFMLISDVILAFMWSTTQSYRMRPVKRKEYLENLEKVMKMKGQDFPGIDIFICTADPYKEPPINVVNTALSVMGYEYPVEKISVYVSDDGGSEFTLFAFMEAAKFGKHWLPFCTNNNIVDRCPEVYFRTNYPQTSDSEKIKIMYESMKIRVENVVQQGKVPEEYITSEQEGEIFRQWSDGFSRHDHPTVIQVLLEAGKDEDIAGRSMPNLIYVSRQKSRTYPHNFKAGALNVLLRVSGAMTNATIILTLDCDMYSNDPITPQRALCYLMDNSIQQNLAYIQFPQRFHGLNRDDIYASELKRLFRVNPSGMDGLAGPSHVGTGCFFRRRAFFGGPLSFIHPEIQELNPDHLVKKHIKDESISDLAHHVAGCNYEHNNNNWGWKIGFRYGSLVEDYNTGYRLQCEGWKSVFCDPERPAFLGDVPISLVDALNQGKRWIVGLYEVGLSKYSPLTYGMRSMGVLMSHCYTHYAFWGIWSIPITFYSFFPQLSLLTGISIFPKVSNPWSFVYVFLFLGGYGQDWLDFVLHEGTTKRWWSDQRMWIIRGLSSFLFGTTEFIVKHLGITTHGFNVTSKVVDDEQGKRYDQGVFEFGVPSPIFVPFVMASIINLISLLVGFVQIYTQGTFDTLFVQIFLSGFGVLNSLPIYEAMLLRTDNGRIHKRTIIISTILSSCLYVTFSSLPRFV